MDDTATCITVTLAAIAGIIFLSLSGKRKPGVSAPVPVIPAGPVADSPALYINVPQTRGPMLAVPQVAGSGGFFDDTSFAGAYPQGF